MKIKMYNFVHSYFQEIVHFYIDINNRVIQQSVAQQLSKIYEPIFSENSYGFRPNRSCHDAILKAKEIMNNGYNWVVDLDLEKFFDTVNQDLLISIIRKTVNEDKVVSLIRKYLQAGVLVNGVFEKTDKGTPQGRKHISNIK